MKNKIFLWVAKNFWLAVYRYIYIHVYMEIEK